MQSIAALSDGVSLRRGPDHVEDGFAHTSEQPQALPSFFIDSAHEAKVYHRHQKGTVYDGVRLATVRVVLVVLIGGEEDVR